MHVELLVLLCSMKKGDDFVKVWHAIELSDKTVNKVLVFPSNLFNNRATSIQLSTGASILLRSLDFLRILAM